MAKPEQACFDRVLPRDLRRATTFRTVPGPGRRTRAMAILPISKLWMNGSTVRVRFIGGTAAQHRITAEQASWWSEHANLHFAFEQVPDAEIRVAFDANDGNWSFVGTDARTVPTAEPTMNLSCLDAGIAAHEFGHAIGLGHEHPALGDWAEETVIAAMAGPPNFWTPEQTRHQIFVTYGTVRFHGAEPDPATIMAPFFPASWFRHGSGEAPRTTLSVADKALVDGARMYPHSR